MPILDNLGWVAVQDGGRMLSMLECESVLQRVHPLIQFLQYPRLRKTLVMTIKPRLSIGKHTFAKRASISLCRSILLGLSGVLDIYSIPDRSSTLNSMLKERDVLSTTTVLVLFARLGVVEPCEGCCLSLGPKVLSIFINNSSTKVG